VIVSHIISPGEIVVKIGTARHLLVFQKVKFVAILLGSDETICMVNYNGREICSLGRIFTLSAALYELRIQKESDFFAVTPRIYSFTCVLKISQC